MDTQVMHDLRTALVLVATALLLSACPGYVKGSEAGMGFDALDTQSKESKENQKWWDSYYGKCHNVWGGSCEGSGGSSSGGGAWDSGGGASDSGVSY